MASVCGSAPAEKGVMGPKGPSSAATLSDYMTLARELQVCCHGMTKVNGAQKLERRIGTEIKFFQTLSRKDEATQAAHLQSSNLSHFAAIVHAVTHLPHVTDVMRPFTSPDRRESLVVDVVADQGRSWVKVIARKGQALHLVWAGQGQYGERDMEQQLQEYAECAERHPVNFHPPRVHATFYNTLTFPMARVLQGQGVTVWGKVVAVDSGVLHKLLAIHDDVEAEDDDEDECLEDFSDVDDSGSVYHGAGTHFCSILAHKVSTKQEEKEETKAVDEIESDNCVDIGSPGGANPTDDQDMHVSCSGLEVRATSLDVGNSLWFRDTVGTSGCDFDVNCREDDDCKNMTDINVSDRLHENSCDHRVSHVSGRPHNDSPVEKAADVLSEVGKQGREYTNSMRSAPVCAASALSHEPRTPSHRLTPHDFKSEDQDTQDLETDSADPNEGLHDSAFNEEARTTTHRETTSWTLSSRSHHCLSRILASYPDYRDLFMLPTFSVSEKSSVGIGGRGGGEGEREKVNLDITTLITLVSSVCHGGCHFRFKDKVLDQQAAEEREHPSLPDLQLYLQDKELVACRTAWSDFDGIVQLLGGPTEQKRAAQLLNRVTVVEDQVSARAARLNHKGKIKDRSKAIFGTGDELQAVTVTANSGFVRAAESQGLSFAVHMHPARALTEKKELTASPL